MLTKNRKLVRFVLSFFVILGVIVYWAWVRIINRGDPGAVWDILMVAIVVSAGFVVFGEERFSKALGESEELTTGRADAQLNGQEGPQSDTQQDTKPDSQTISNQD